MGLLGAWARDEDVFIGLAAFACVAPFPFRLALALVAVLAFPRDALAPESAGVSRSFCCEEWSRVRRRGV